MQIKQGKQRRIKVTFTAESKANMSINATRITESKKKIIINKSLPESEDYAVKFNPAIVGICRYDRCIYPVNEIYSEDYADFARAIKNYAVEAVSFITSAASINNSHINIMPEDYNQLAHIKYISGPKKLGLVLNEEAELNSFINGFSNMSLEDNKRHHVKLFEGKPSWNDIPIYVKEAETCKVEELYEESRIAWPSTLVKKPGYLKICSDLVISDHLISLLSVIQGADIAFQKLYKMDFNKFLGAYIYHKIKNDRANIDKGSILKNVKLKEVSVFEADYNELVNHENFTKACNINIHDFFIMYQGLNRDQEIYSSFNSEFIAFYVEVMNKCKNFVERDYKKLSKSDDDSVSILQSNKFYDFGFGRLEITGNNLSFLYMSLFNLLERFEYNILLLIMKQYDITKFTLEHAISMLDKDELEFKGTNMTLLDAFGYITQESEEAEELEKDIFGIKLSDSEKNEFNRKIALETYTKDFGRLKTGISAGIRINSLILSNVSLNFSVKDKIISYLIKGVRL